MMKITNYKQYNKRITSHNNGVQSHDQEESKFNSTLKYDKINNKKVNLIRIT